MLTGSETYHTLRGPIDTLLVAGGSGVETAARDEELLLWLQKTAQRVRRIGSVCTGAFLTCFGRAFGRQARDDTLEMGGGAGT